MSVLRWAGGRLRELPGAIAYLVVGGLTGVLALVAAVVLTFVGAASLGLVGIPAIPEAIRLTRFVPRLERKRAAARLGEPIDTVYQPFTGGLRQRLATAFGDPANVRDVGWIYVHGLLGMVLALFAVALPVSTLVQLLVPLYWKLLPSGTIDNYGFAVDSWATARLSALISIPLAMLTLQLPVVARWQAHTAKTVLGPSEEALKVRVAELTATRAAALDAHGAELRRIERDLHDGAQARIAAVIMQLGLAEQLRQQDPEAADNLIRKAQDTATTALAELRDLVRSVYPPVLADLGLASAVSALAARSPIPCVLEIDGCEIAGDSRRDMNAHPRHPGALLGRDPHGQRMTSTVDPGQRHAGMTGAGSHGPYDPMVAGLRRRPAAVEAAAYFVIAEAITNATKHSGAANLSVAISGAAELLTVEVRDDGTGAAREVEGGGLAGIRRRAEALDGRMMLSSPEGGPTVVRVELPCGS
ncbi:sensor histidine kinase [Nocardia huaxiensis]|uniref:sensor histidine kinase n=1 Tax=Nocardia huaxiensis TaxID=2755382 RepID=UPI001E41B43E|nr:sensor domain-containing protein [Nocardia huaxiensis]UFS94756.1 sensor domain-containing protein [Nocardia huaxiensis]